MDALYSQGIDWTRTDRTDRIKVELVQTTNVNQSLGFLGGVTIKGGTIDENYYTDARISAKVSYVGDALEKDCFIRIWHTVEGTGYAQALGTFVIANAPTEYDSGAWVTTLSLQSVLFAASKSKLNRPITVKARTSTKGALAALAHEAGFLIIDRTTMDGTCARDIVYNAGKSHLEVMFDLCKNSSKRLEVDEFGRICIDDWCPPSSRPNMFSLTTTSRRGVIDGNISITSDEKDQPSAVVVVGKQGENEVYGYAEMAQGDASKRIRGYNVTKQVNVSDMQGKDPTTYARNELAHLAMATTEYNLKTIYFPVHVGACGTLVLPSDTPRGLAGEHKVMVKTRTVDLFTMKQTLKLKEVAGYWNDAIEQQGSEKNWT